MNIPTMFYHTQEYEQDPKVPLAIEIVHKYLMCDVNTQKPQLAIINFVQTN